MADRSRVGYLPRELADEVRRWAPPEVSYNEMFDLQRLAERIWAAGYEAAWLAGYDEGRDAHKRPDVNDVNGYVRRSRQRRKRRTVPDVPPIPMSCADRPTVGGLVAPYVNIRLADGGVDFRTPHQATYQRCWTEGLCQTCGQRITGRAVLFGGPRQLAKRHFDEPPLCVPCAVYASRACPMVAGRMPFYADRERLAEGRRGHVCPDESCACGGFTASDPNAYDASGEPAHAWYAVYVRPGAWQLTGKQVRVPCSDLGCLHDRTLVNGALLTADPLKVVLVSSPSEGQGVPDA